MLALGSGSCTIPLTTCDKGRKYACSVGKNNRDQCMLGQDSRMSCLQQRRASLWSVRTFRDHKTSCQLLAFSPMRRQITLTAHSLLEGLAGRQLR